ncbi:Centaurin-gamma, putative [Pediculus humanus corporis]|uniref:Centaurin-gamma, putative n=1 Tax=Pediculus humanus subsp. corporis TaxID=121224 RepID=E0VZ03_PEDHC|nr:Centaurin-gamma, putative [Pediculus humanus corporis]EEB18609.1 Centaurin-gamma, putative [Pediculus humanus corporis]
MCDINCEIIRYLVDSFVNSQEWTLSRGVPDLRLGIVGSLSSGKSALVHRYLTGSYMQEESPEGGRFKKEILVDGQSYLLLIRDEGGPPELQFTSWVDAVIFVFSLENEASFNAIYNYYTKMAHYRNSSEIPLILVGTQDAISENNPRVIDDSRARKLASDLKRCSYYETCATYGLNVERVFQDACQKIVQQRLNNQITSQVPGTPTNSRPSTPNNHFSSMIPIGNVGLRHYSQPSPTNGIINTSSSSGGSPSTNNTLASASPCHIPHKESMSRQIHALSASSHQLHRHPDIISKADVSLRNEEKRAGSYATLGISQTHTFTTENNNTKFGQSQNVENTGTSGKDKDLPTPSSTPTTSRKTRRRSNLFTSSKKGDDKLKNGGELGSGRAIPLKQGLLYKRSSKSLNKEWKKKYVTLCDDGRLIYYPNLQDYMDNIHGKEISLQYVTVKVPGQKPRGSRSIIPASNGLNDGISNLSLCNYVGKDKKLGDKSSLSTFDANKDSGSLSLPQQNDDGIPSNNSVFINGADLRIETPNVKKRHRRIKSSGVKNAECDDPDGYEFFIVSLDNKQWHFEASNSEERDDWVSAIEQQILNSLQGNEISKSRSRFAIVDSAVLIAVKNKVPGNAYCVDCDAPKPCWASINLGVLMCIECSGIHRNLGSHISRVRSLDLDEWPPGPLSLMLAIGNAMANSIWERNTGGQTKPNFSSSREEKERWIRAKYENKEFLQSLSYSTPINQQLIDAICRADIKALLIILAHSTPEDVNCTVSGQDLRTPLHLASAMGNLPVAQLLIWYGANPRTLDHEGRSCLSYAMTASCKSTTDVTNLINLLTDVGATPSDSGTNRRSSTGRKDLPTFNKVTI